MRSNEIFSILGHIVYNMNGVKSFTLTKSRFFIEISLDLKMMVKPFRRSYHRKIVNELRGMCYDSVTIDGIDYIFD